MSSEVLAGDEMRRAGWSPKQIVSHRGLLARRIAEAWMEGSDKLKNTGGL